MRSAQTVLSRFCPLLLLLLATRGGAMAQLQMGPELRVNTGTVGEQTHPSVAVDAAGNFLVVWAGDAVAAQRFDVRGRRRGGELLIDDEFSASIDVAMNGAGEFVAAWTGTFARLTVGRFAPTGAATFGPVERYGYSAAAVGTAADGSFVVAWSNYSFYYGAYPSIERFDRRGRSLETIYQGGYTPALAMNPAGDFILVWGSDRRILGQRFDAA